MSGQGKRPELKRYGSDEFFEIAKRLGFSHDADAKNVWMHLVQVVKGVRYSSSDAAAKETLTCSQIVAVVSGGKGQFRGMSGWRWDLAVKVKVYLEQALPRRGGEVLRHFDALQTFVGSRNGSDLRNAARIWTVLVRDGLGIKCWNTDATRQFQVPDSVIRAMAESDSSEHRNLGPTLKEILVAWSKTL